MNRKQHEEVCIRLEAIIDMLGMVIHNTGHQEAAGCYTEVTAAEILGADNVYSRNEPQRSWLRRMMAKIKGGK